MQIIFIICKTRFTTRMSAWSRQFNAFREDTLVNRPWSTQFFFVPKYYQQSNTYYIFCFTLFLKLFLWTKEMQALHYFLKEIRVHRIVLNEWKSYNLATVVVVVVVVFLFSLIDTQWLYIFMGCWVIFCYVYTKYNDQLRVISTSVWLLLMRDCKIWKIGE